MKKSILSVLLTTLAFFSNAQSLTTPPAECGDLFFSELTFGKVPKASSLFDLNYAVEIFNPTASPISLSGYTLELSNSVGTVTTIQLSGTVPAKDVFVVCNSNADLNLQSLADHLTAGLDFETNVILDLKNNGITLDRIGQTGTPTSGSIDIVQLMQDPYSYLSTFHLDLNDYENVDIRRGLFVTKGNPTFNSATDLIGNWSYRLNVDRTDIGNHHCMCNKPAGIDYIGFSENGNHYIWENQIGAIDPLTLRINPDASGVNQPLSNPGLVLTYTVQGDAPICNSSAIAPLIWDNYLSTCGSLNNIVINTSDIPRVKRSTMPLLVPNFPNAPFALYTLISGNTSLWEIDLSRTNHFTVIIPGDPQSVSNINKDLDVFLNSNVTYSDLEVSVKNNSNYFIYDMAGKCISKGIVTKSNNHITTTNLASGLYLIKFANNKNKSLTQKFQKL